ncbi:integral membrane protein TmpA [Aspergillus piperis CBS 112811]|uniref:Integral membrane protein TmpA n=1 Tax=Aspergillus piperis CBS 112811 TaxID=1448313 RepID=A0A8G1QZH3_9EURO|nr:integral membrane protein TmpA [Aspergillus piperis CBS 112811]RAH56417.1 integral membrane protein TmpA [Aspergillus piperis CBS 112811]
MDSGHVSTPVPPPPPAIQLPNQSEKGPTNISFPINVSVLPVEKEETPSRQSIDTRLFLWPSIYRYIFSLVFLGNVAALIYFILRDWSAIRFVDAAAANFLASALARQAIVVNGMFQIVCSLSLRLPLRLRRVAANIYHYGGVHSGCGVAALIWYVGAVVMLTRLAITRVRGNSHHHHLSNHTLITLILAYLVLVLLAVIIAVAYPTVRLRYHNSFEFAHRFLTWLVVALFLSLLVLVVGDSSLTPSTATISVSPAASLVRLPAFWCVLTTVIAIIQPWTRLRRIRVQAERLSTHAIRLHLSGADARFGKTISLATHPLQDWHSFATFPDEPRCIDIDDEEAATAKTSAAKGSYYCSVLVSRAGDWTGARINEPPTELWTRGEQPYGFTRVMRLFRRVVIVATGSGIGPCLAFLAEGGEACRRPAIRLVWQTRSPQRTYGSRVLDLVHRLDPEAMILDTSKQGRRVDLLPWVVDHCLAYRGFEAEMVCVISNRSLTHTLVSQLRSRGIPAMGPLFDS